MRVVIISTRNVAYSLLARLVLVFGVVGPLGFEVVERAQAVLERELASLLRLEHLHLLDDQPLQLDTYIGINRN